MAEQNVEKAKALVTEPMLRIGIAGTTHDLIRRLEGLVEMGVQHISLGPPLGPEPLAMIEAVGREVLPYFRG
jgi:5,10-methylenetetrahydromethanopterin reductase